MTLRYTSFHLAVISILGLLFVQHGSSVRVGVASQTPSDVQVDAVRGLLSRLFDTGANLFEVQINSSTTDTTKDFFSISSSAKSGCKILIRGSTGYAAANGINYYLKNYLHGQFTWSSNNTALPDELPIPEKEIKISLNDEYRYYENVCTSSYSMVWWGWSRWQREIDWMALNGINMPLAFVGQEAIAAKVFRNFGCNQTDLDGFFTGPAFLSWNRMGNLRGFGGPLPDYWMNLEFVLQTLILKRMKEFGMTPVTPGFNGYVPRKFETLYPNASIVRGSNWMNFPAEYNSPSFINPDDPLFAQVQTAYIQLYNDAFGSGHIYNIDLFNEMLPTTNSADGLSKISLGVLKGIRDADDQGIWLMQGWLFYNNKAFWTPDMIQAFVTAVPQRSLVLLDLFSEQAPQFSRTQGYFGVPFIWCMLHNYGGVSGLFGNFEWENTPVIEARKNYSNMIGIGITPEGTGQNEIIYEFMLENSYRTQSENVSSWVSSFIENRYGYTDKNLTTAWQMLMKSVYNFTDKANTNVNHGVYILTTRPDISLEPRSWYNFTDLMIAGMSYHYSAASNPQLCKTKAFEYDSVDIVRQAIQVSVASAYQKVVYAYLAQNLTALEENAKTMLYDLQLLDKVLACHEAFMVGPWIEGAINAAGPNETDQALFEYNARNQITLWGPDGQILDYAAKMWSGVVADYYLPRWSMFIDYLRNAIQTSTLVDETKMHQDMLENIEKPFTYSRKKYPVTPVTNICDLLQQEHEYLEKLFHMQEIVPKIGPDLHKTFNTIIHYPE